MKRIITATFKMDKGDIVFRIYDETPIHSSRFIKNANDDLFKGIAFDRVIPGFMAQSGPNKPSKGSHHYMWDEIKPPRRTKDNNFHAYGVLSAANTGQPDSGAGAFFVCFSRNGTRHLDTGHTTFGHVLDGWENIERIEKGDIVNDVIINTYDLNKMEESYINTK